MQSAYVQTITRAAIGETLHLCPKTPQTWSRHPDFPRSVALGGTTGRTVLYPAQAVYQWLLDHQKAAPSQIRDLQILEETIEVQA